MIASLFRVLFFALLGLALVWGVWLLLPQVSQVSETKDEALFDDAFPRHSPEPRRGVEISFLQLCQSWLPVEMESLLAAKHLIARRVSVSATLLPFWLVFIAAAFLGGALLRERLHLGSAYASPAASFIFKRIGESAVVLFFLWSFSPLPMPYWVFYPALLASMASVQVYIANLPLRL